MMDQTTPSLHYGFLGYRLDSSSRRLLNPEGNAVALNDRAFDTLCCLVANAGQTLSKDFLLAAVWSTEVVEENNLNQAVLTLRKALGDDSRNPVFIRTVTRRGFCFVAPVEVLEPVAEVEAPLYTGMSPPPRQGTRVPWPYAAALLLGITAALALALVWPSARQADSGSAMALDHVNTLPEPPLLPDSIAILPFRTMTNEATEDLLSAGLHAAVIARLSAVDGLNVISRESVMNRSLDPGDLAGIRETLRVKAVMSGTVLHSGDQVRINLELIDSTSQLALWSDSYEINTHDLENIFAVQSDIAIHAAEALAAVLDQHTLEEMRLQPTHSFEAYGYLLASRQAFEMQEYERAWNLGKMALELDPHYLDAIYNLSHVHAVLISMPLPQVGSEQHLERALELADLYIELAPDDPLGYSLRGAALNIVGDWQGVLAELDRIRDKGFSLDDMRFNSFMLALGKFDAVITALEKRLQTDPLNPYTRGFLMVAHESTGNRQRSRELYQVGESLHGQWWGDQVEVILRLGRNESLHDIASLRVSEELKHILYRLEDRGYVSTTLQSHLRQENSNAVELIHFAAIAAYIGEQHTALQLLHSAVENSWLSMLWAWLPVFDELRASERFYPMIAELGVTEYWNRLGWSDVCNPDSQLATCSWQAYTGL